MLFQNTHHIGLRFFHGFLLFAPIPTKRRDHLIFPNGKRPLPLSAALFFSNFTTPVSGFQATVVHTSFFAPQNHAAAILYSGPALNFLPPLWYNNNK